MQIFLYLLMSITNPVMIMCSYYYAIYRLQPHSSQIIRVILLQVLCIVVNLQICTAAISYHFVYQKLHKLTPKILQNVNMNLYVIY